MCSSLPALPIGWGRGSRAFLVSVFFLNSTIRTVITARSTTMIPTVTTATTGNAISLLDISSLPVHAGVWRGFEVMSPPITVTVGTILLGMVECIIGGVGEVAGFSAEGSVTTRRDRKQYMYNHNIYCRDITYATFMQCIAEPPLCFKLSLVMIRIHTTLQNVFPNFLTLLSHMTGHCSPSSGEYYTQLYALLICMLYIGCNVSDFLHCLPCLLSIFGLCQVCYYGLMQSSSFVYRNSGLAFKSTYF